MNFIQTYLHPLSNQELSKFKNNIQAKHNVCRRTLNRHIKHPKEMKVELAKTIATKMGITYQNFLEQCK
jgi:hypothetical protein